MTDDMRIPRGLTDRFVLACRCGRGLSWRDMQRLEPLRERYCPSVTVRRIVCEECCNAALDG